MLTLIGVGEYGAYTVDVDTVLDDDVIWRTIINGYPYKTPQEQYIQIYIIEM